MNKGKCNWNCCCDNKGWGGKSNSNHWGCCEQKNKCEDKKQDNKFCCFCCECEKKQEEKRPSQKHCPCQCKEEEKENYGCKFDYGFDGKDYGYDYGQNNFGYDNFYSQGY